MRVLLLAWMLLTGGCAAIDSTLPDPSRTLREYQADTALPKLEPLPLSRPMAVAGSVGDEQAACFVGTAIEDLEAFAAAARANTEALTGVILALYAQHAEARALLEAGRAAEAQAELYRALYKDEAGQALLMRLGSAGLLVLLGVGAVL